MVQSHKAHWANKKLVDYHFLFLVCLDSAIDIECLWTPKNLGTRTSCYPEVEPCTSGLPRCRFAESIPRAAFRGNVRRAGRQSETGSDPPSEEAASRTTSVQSPSVAFCLRETSELI